MIAIVKIFKNTLMTLLSCYATVFAQNTTIPQQPSSPEKSGVLNENGFQQKTDDLNINLKLDINDLVKNIVVKVNDVVPKIADNQTKIKL